MRKAKPKKRILLPDPKFGDVAVTRFVNNLMLDGNTLLTIQHKVVHETRYCDIAELRIRK